MPVLCTVTSMYVCIRLRRESGREVRWDPVVGSLSTRVGSQSSGAKGPGDRGGTDGPVGAMGLIMGGLRLFPGNEKWRSEITSEIPRSEPVGLGGPLRAG